MADPQDDWLEEGGSKRRKWCVGVLNEKTTDEVPGAPPLRLISPQADHAARLRDPALAGVGQERAAGAVQHPRAPVALVAAAAVPDAVEPAHVADVLPPPEEEDDAGRPHHPRAAARGHAQRPAQLAVLEAQRRPALARLL